MLRTKKQKLYSSQDEYFKNFKVLERVKEDIEKSGNFVEIVNVRSQLNNHIGYRITEKEGLGLSFFISAKKYDFSDSLSINKNYLMRLDDPFFFFFLTFQSVKTNNGFEYEEFPTTRYYLFNTSLTTRYAGENLHLENDYRGEKMSSVPLMLGTRVHLFSKDRKKEENI